MSTRTTSLLRTAAPRALALAAATAAFVPAAALAAGAPSAVISDSPVHNTDNSYTLLDDVDPSGAATTATFEYGSTSALGNSISAGTVSATSGLTEVSGKTPTLTVGSGLYYRLKVQNAYGTDYSDIESITVTGAPLVYIGASPVRNSDGSFTLRATVDPQGLASDAYIEYGSSATSYTNLIGGVTIPVGPAQQEFGITSANLISGATIHYAGFATNDDGSTVEPDQTFVVPTGRPFVNPGTAPVRNSSGSYTIHALVNPDGFTTTNAFQYGTTTSYGTTVGSVSTSPGAPQQVPGFVPAYPAGTTVHYRFTATNSAGATVYGADQTYVAS